MAKTLEIKQMVNLLYDIVEKTSLDDVKPTKICILGVTHFGRRLDWQTLADKSREGMAKGNLELRIYREQEDAIFSQSLLSEEMSLNDLNDDVTGYSFDRLKKPYEQTIDVIRNSLFTYCVTGIDEKNHMRRVANLPSNSSKNFNDNFSVRNVWFNVPVPSIYLKYYGDDGKEIEEYYITLSLTNFSSDGRKYELIDEKNEHWKEYKKYFDVYMELNGKRNKYISESYAEALEGVSDDEVLELYERNNDDNIRYSRGLFPRNSFYETNNAQLVIWAFVFDRKGKLLIHQRKWNASDNVGMWDKSVGGHVDRTDLDSTYAATRELVEELFTEEGVNQSSHGTAFQRADTSNFIFMGDWNPKARGQAPFQEIARNRNQWYYFRLPDSTAAFRPSDRVMPPTFKITYVDGHEETLKLKGEKIRGLFEDESILAFATNILKDDNYSSPWTKSHNFNANNTDLLKASDITTTVLLDMIDYFGSKKKKTWKEITTKELSLKQEYIDLDVNFENGKRKLNVITDIYFFVADESFNSETLDGLKNSRYQLLSLNKLKRLARDSELKFSPDIENVLLHNTDQLLNRLESFASMIEEVLNPEGDE